MDSAPVVIQAVIATLNGNTAVNALLSGRIFTDVPQGETFPYLVLNIDSDPFAAADFSGQSHKLRLQVFSQYKGKKEALKVRKACLDALDRQESAISLLEGTLVKCEYLGSEEPFKEDDGKTWQAIGEFEVIVV